MNEELLKLRFELGLMTETERKDKENVLIVIGKGFLNGQEAFEYLNELFDKHNKS